MSSALGAVPVVPAIAARLHVEPVAGEGVALIGESGGLFFDDPAVTRVAQLIDGRRTTSDIVGLLAAELPADTVIHALGTLVSERAIGEAAGIPAGLAAVWSEFGVDEFRLARLLQATTIGLIPLGSTGAGEVRAALEAFGLRVVLGVPGAARSLDVVVVEDYLDPRLETVNAQALSDGRPWLPVKASGINLWAGPVFVPPLSACWECLRVRLRQNRPVESYLHRSLGRTVPLPVGRDHTGALTGHAHSMAAAMVVRWLASPEERPAMAHTLTVIEALALAVSRHAVKRRPQCRACGDASLALPAPGPPELSRPARPVVSRDGGEHTEPPEATFHRFAALVSPVTGMVSQVVPSPWNSAGPLRSFAAGHNHALSSDTLRAATDSLRSWSSGKGRTDAQARTSALCEALERLSGVWTGDEPTVRDSMNGLGSDAVDPRACLQFSERQYRERHRWRSVGSAFQVVPDPFQPDAPIDWSPLWSLTHQRRRYLPSSYLFFGYPHDPARFFAWPDSNGNAAGATLADACLQGIYELIERDAVALWWYNRVPRPGVDLDGLDDPWVAELTSWYERHGRRFWVLDISADLGIPAFAALSERVDGPTSDIVLGFGAHHDPRLAVSRALTEMNQFMPAVLDIAPDGSTRYQVGDALTLRWWRTANLDNQPYLRPLRSVAPTSLDEPPQERPSAEWFERAVARLEAKGHEVLVLDQTRPDVELPVVKVVVPGLRHFWARFAPGRLYEVPVQLGWLPVALDEEQLNPIPMFL